MGAMVFTAPSLCTYSIVCIKVEMTQPEDAGVMCVCVCVCVCVCARVRVSVCIFYINCVTQVQQLSARPSVSV